MASNYQLSHLRPCRESNPGLRGGRRECYHSATVAPTVIGDRQARESIMQKYPTQFLGNSISPTNEVKNLGVTFDSGNTFVSHITKVCFACYYHLEDVRRIHKFLSVETTALLANSMISSRIDYCNSLLYGVNKYNVAKLQKDSKCPLQNCFQT